MLIQNLSKKEISISRKSVRGPSIYYVNTCRGEGSYKMAMFAYFQYTCLFVCLFVSEATQFSEWSHGKREYKMSYTLVVGGISGKGRCCIALSSTTTALLSGGIISLSWILTDLRDRRFSAPRGIGAFVPWPLRLVGEDKFVLSVTSLLASRPDPTLSSVLFFPLSSKIRGLVRDRSPKLLFRSEICK